MKPDIQQLLADHAHLAYAFAMAHASVDQQILHLIQSDLRHHRLLHGLLQSGIQADAFHLDLHLTIFHLLGFTKQQQESSSLHDFYWQLKEQCMGGELMEFFEQVPDLALQVYEGLCKWKATSCVNEECRKR